MSYDYIIRNSRRKRPQTKYIIITHAINLIQDYFRISPELVSRNNFFTCGVINDYFIESLHHDYLPYHFYFDKIGNDWFSFKGIPEKQPSYYIEDLVSSGILKYQYLDSMLIVIDDDFSKFPLEKRLCEQMCCNTISDLMLRYQLDFSRVKYIDECLHEDWEENLKSSAIPYKYTLQKFFNMQLLRLNIGKYKKV